MKNLKLIFALFLSLSLIISQNSFALMKGGKGLKSVESKKGETLSNKQTKELEAALTDYIIENDLDQEEQVLAWEALDVFIEDYEGGFESETAWWIIPLLIIVETVIGVVGAGMMSPGMYSTDDPSNGGTPGSCYEGYDPEWEEEFEDGINMIINGDRDVCTDLLIPVFLTNCDTQQFPPDMLVCLLQEFGCDMPVCP